MPGAIIEPENPPDEEGIHHWTTLTDAPKDHKKYFGQRHKFFSKYDEGIWMTDDAWFEVTPEPIANKIAAHISEAVGPEKSVLIDAFAGVGANAIAFALEGRWEHIFAIEKNPAALKCAKHNAKVYGVEKKISWVNGDCFDILPQRYSDMGDKAVLFASPPWGGPGYSTDKVFNLSTMQPYSLDFIYSRFSRVCKTMVLYLPRTSDLNQIAKFAPEGKKLEVAHYCITGASKALCVYIGDFNFPE
ncbi:S-adenosyl-L-methionine-dependent methyltransferase [Delitschia confertaspora ATCC 74209]|uniref:Trimethylguanosine synthase n=1 Tax=Delitschia confertaspora ATCC 74209 TaxID=1513339 RepID=A0A9P4JK87_9PLEO|nr:S-adenosyl-L-methionine-dependent methyltransferase [Delitschia confertaspora ATCC 74209]